MISSSGKNESCYTSLMAQTRCRVAVLYGGRSGEHEISIRSANSVMKNLDSSRFDVTPVFINKEGQWSIADIPVTLLPYPAVSGETIFEELHNQRKRHTFDVVFPVLHGTFCEDGTLQGCLDLAESAYVGCGVVASSVCMDKEVAKRLIRDAGLPIVSYILATEIDITKGKIGERVEKELGYPCFVKPSNAGSSVGVHKVKKPEGLIDALRDAFRYDTKVLIEKAIDAREIEVAILEHAKYGEAPMASIVGEIAPTHEFYSYEAKYLDDNGAELLIPAKLSEDQQKEIQKLAVKIFQSLCCEGMSRVDLFMDRKTGALYFNEVNTIPGFTSISMYPKLWEASGIPYADLLSRLVDLAVAKQKRKRKLLRSFDGA